MSGPDVLRRPDLSGTIGEVAEDEATTLMLEALFDIGAAVYEIHDVVVWNGEDEDAEEEEEDDA